MTLSPGADPVADLGLHYRPPARSALDKEVDHLDRHCRDYIAHAPLFILASRGDDGRIDVSPRGGPPGFARVLDEHRLVVPDMAGNNRLDSMRNIINGGQVAMLFLVPGVDETLRVNGKASVTVDDRLLAACPVAEKQPNVAVVIDVHVAFIHCGKAMRRAAIWTSERWPDVSTMASPALMLKDHIRLDGVNDLGPALEASYAATTWAMGGATGTEGLSKRTARPESSSTDQGDPMQLNDPFARHHEVPSFTVTSTTVRDGSPLGTAQMSGTFGVPGGKDVSPQLSWSDAPEGTKSYAVTIYDPDAPTGSGFWHWAVANIPADIREVAEGAGDDMGSGLPDGAVQYRNDAGQHRFLGAAPPAGHGQHRYYIVVYALDVDDIGAPADATPALLGFNLFGHTLGRAVMEATAEID